MVLPLSRTSKTVLAVSTRSSLSGSQGYQCAHQFEVTEGHTEAILYVV